MSSVIIHAPLYFHGVVTQGHAASAREWDSRRRLAPTSSKPPPIPLQQQQANIFETIKYFCSNQIFSTHLMCGAAPPERPGNE